MRAVAFTGHRPAELGSYNPEDLKPLLWELRRVIVDHIENKDVDTFYGGNALGWDLWSQKIVIKLKETYPHTKLITWKFAIVTWLIMLILLLPGIMERKREGRQIV